VNHRNPKNNTFDGLKDPLYPFVGQLMIKASSEREI